MAVCSHAPEVRTSIRVEPDCPVPVFKGAGWYLNRGRSISEQHIQIASKFTPTLPPGVLSVMAILRKMRHGVRS